MLIVEKIEENNIIKLISIDKDDIDNLVVKVGGNDKDKGQIIPSGAAANN